MKESQTFLDECKNCSSLRKLFSGSAVLRLARQTGMIIRKRKLSAMAFLHVCTFFGTANRYPSIEQMRGELLSMFGIRIGKSSLFERFNSGAVDFMRSMFEKVISTEFARKYSGEFFDSFSDIILTDSTIINLGKRCSSLFAGFGGGASEAAGKIQVMISLLSGKFWDISLLPGRKSDNSYRFGNILEGALYLFDLGYCNAANLNQIISQNAWFLSRYKYKSSILLPDGTRISMAELHKKVRRLKNWELLELDVLIIKDGKVPCRLVLQKLPKKISNEKRRKLKTDKQKKCKNLSDGRLAFCDVNAFITNLPPEKLSAKNVRMLYALRWQIELLFKAWKSYLGIDNTRNVGPCQFQCCLYGYLIRMVISSQLFWKAKLICWIRHHIELSELKAFEFLFTAKESFRDWLFTRRTNNRKFLETIWDRLVHTCQKERKKGRQRPFEVLMMIA